MVPGPCLNIMWVSAPRPCPTSAMINEQWKQSNGRPCVRVQTLLVLTVQTPYLSPHVPLDDPLIFPSLLVTPVFLSQVVPRSRNFIFARIQYFKQTQDMGRHETSTRRQPSKSKSLYNSTENIFNINNNNRMAWPTKSCHRASIPTWQCSRVAAGTL